MFELKWAEKQYFIIYVEMYHISIYYIFKKPQYKFLKANFKNMCICEILIVVSKMYGKSNQTTIICVTCYIDAKRFCQLIPSLSEKSIIFVKQMIKNI